MAKSPAKEGDPDQDSNIVRPAEPAEAERTELPTSQTHDLVPAPARTNLPVPLSTSKKMSVRWRLLRVVLAVAIIAGGAGGGFYWWRHSQSQLPSGIASGNGRIEADEIDIGTKFAGRIAEMFADQGDMVKAGQIVARMDTQDLAASLKKAEAQVQLSQRAIEETRALVVQQETQVALAKQQLDRTTVLTRQGNATLELLDQRRQQMNASTALLIALTARVAQAEHALAASRQDVELYKVNIADNTLVAPRDGRIQYRVANIGEVLPAGGKVFTMLDISYVYMDVYLPTGDAGKVKFGADARIVLNSYPNVAIPAKVSFIATQAQFTPKAVETKNERDKLMFRIRVRIEPDRLRARGDRVTSGLPGVAYIRFDPATAWPPQLQGNTGQ